MLLEKLAEAMETRTLTVRGVSLTVRALSAVESHRVAELAGPPPRPPTRPDPNRGSRAPHVPDHDDPGYQRSIEKHWAVHESLHAAFAAGLAPDPRQPETDEDRREPGTPDRYEPPQALELARRVMHTLSSYEIKEICRASLELAGYRDGGRELAGDGDQEGGSAAREARGGRGGEVDLESSDLGK